MVVARYCWSDKEKYTIDDGDRNDYCRKEFCETVNSLFFLKNILLKISKDVNREILNIIIIKGSLQFPRVYATS